jgi:hypothetical protein
MNKVNNRTRKEEENKLEEAKILTNKHNIILRIIAKSDKGTVYKEDFIKAFYSL